MTQEYIEIEDVRLIRQTDKAGLFDVDGEEIWIPWSQVDEGCELQSDGDEGTLIITEWIADQKGLA